METLQSRLDADFLLAHMCSVKFKEWIVVLATLLRCSEVLFDLFRHDVRLWKAYSTTLQCIKIKLQTLQRTMHHFLGNHLILWTRKRRDVLVYHDLVYKSYGGSSLNPEWCV
ncbi:hypothetical protein PIB30_084553 [Stylosanthes scabra]|uniref:Uncharacterized protein n=1 Tax=Stylosanthes scabra TaxID=79078 RepID=A0ABU6TTA1_9FABA|nr:hypothetical protein [Stylosanthes scabra]